MPEIEVNEYVRTKDGKILKIDSFEKDLRNIEIVCFTTGEVYTRELLNEIIVKHSKDIIDLIEIGDYVNGHKIIMDLKKSKKYYHSKDDFVTAVNYTFEESEIKSIVTHEQFSSIEYKV